MHVDNKAKYRTNTYICAGFKVSYHEGAEWNGGKDYKYKMGL